MGDMKRNIEPGKNNIYTFADCPDRVEHRKGDPGPFGGSYGDMDSLESICPDACPLGARAMDYSVCLSPNNPCVNGHACSVGRGGIEINSGWCEAMIRDRTCPRKYAR